VTLALRTDQLARLFQMAGSAHHAAFAATNGDDPDWPAWYAAWLAPALTELLGQAIPTAALAGDLRSVDAAHRATGAGTSSPAFYADWFLQAYSPPGDNSVAELPGQPAARLPLRA
jgi:hypothetical protein